MTVNQLIKTCRSLTIVKAAIKWMSLPTLRFSLRYSKTRRYPPRPPCNCTTPNYKIYCINNHSSLACHSVLLKRRPAHLNRPSRFPDFKNCSKLSVGSVRIFNREFCCCCLCKALRVHFLKSCFIVLSVIKFHYLRAHEADVVTLSPEFRDSV